MIPGSCEITYYEQEIRNFDSYKGVHILYVENDERQIFLEFGDFWTYVREKIPLMSTNSLLSSVGGLFGLFMGFSFLSTIVRLLDHILPFAMNEHSY